MFGGFVSAGYTLIQYLIQLYSKKIFYAKNPEWKNYLEHEKKQKKLLNSNKIDDFNDNNNNNKNNNKLENNNNQK